MADAFSITQELGGRWYGGYGLCRCPAHADRNPSLSVSDGYEGRLLVYCFAGCNFRDVMAELNALGVVGDTFCFVETNPALEAQRKAAENQDREKRVRQARRAWNETAPIRGTLAERYLRSRSINTTLPPSLRYAKDAWHGPSARRLPAMVAAITLDGSPGIVAVHRTYLDESGVKADVRPNKSMVGPVKGAGVRLSDGAGPLVIAEGIETALSLKGALADFSPCVVAALSTSGVAGFKLPKCPAELVIAPDGDTPGMAAGEKLAMRAHAAGWRVRILPPPGEGLDWNDVAREVTP